MKVIYSKITFVLVVFFLVSHISIGQTYSEETNKNNSKETLKEANLSTGMFSSYFNNTNASKTAVVQGSSVFLKQIGQANQAKVQVSAQASDINVLQNGNNNDVNLTYQVNSVATALQQNGNNNYIMDHVVNPNEDVTLQLKQNGDNLNFERFGSNQLSKNIKFNQTSASPTVIIRSFK